MKAAVIYKPGGPENFVIEERPLPVAATGQLLIKVKAFGLNRSELMTRKGLSPDVNFPRVLGIECVGEVEYDPAGKFVKGQQVAALMGEMGRQYDGSYAEYTVLPGSIVFPFKSKLPWDQLGAFPEMFQTTYGSLHRALNVKKGETILIRGGTSSIGMLAAQMAKNAGLTVISTTRNINKKNILLQNGVDEVLIDDGALSSKIKSKFKDGVDNVLELIGTTTLKDSLLCAKPGGTVCMTGILSEQWSVSEFTPMEFIPATVRLTVYDSGQIKIDAKYFQEFIDDVEAGKIRLNVSRVFSLDQITEAHQLMDSNSASGKIVGVP